MPPDVAAPIPDKPIDKEVSYGIFQEKEVE